MSSCEKSDCHECRKMESDIAEYTKRIKEQETEIENLKSLTAKLSDNRLSRLVKDQAQAISALIKAIQDEPELPGEMPDEMWNMLNGNRRLTKRALVHAVKSTKEGILKKASMDPIVAKALET